MKVFFSTIGQDSHRIKLEKDKPLILGGVTFDAHYCLEANSDGDVILHAITNAISGATTYNVLGGKADEMCKNGITDSKMYVLEALSKAKGMTIEHISISIEALRPKFLPLIPDMRKSISKILGIKESKIGITATTGEGLTEFGKGNGIFVTVIISWSKDV